MAAEIRVEQGDMREVLAHLKADGLVAHACVTDPPYHLSSIVKRFGARNAKPPRAGKDGTGASGVFKRSARGFMGKRWDGGDIAFRPETWRLVWDVLPPGGHLLAFCGTRSYHRMACAVEDAGFEVRDCLAWLYGTGFPKSRDVGKAIDREAGAKRKAVGTDARRAARLKNQTGHYVSPNGFRTGSRSVDITEPATDAARQWDGWGTALKPALELIVMARKPMGITVAANVLAYGTGALHVDACRVGERERPKITDPKRTKNTYGKIDHPGGKLLPDQRWPANVLHDGSAEVVQLFPDSGAAGPRRELKRNPKPGRSDGYGMDKGPLPPSGLSFGDGGNAARFFYSAKADTDERLASKHPTIKPVDLMRWLVRLVTPPRGLVLDPFAGSGTTGMACMAEGFDAVLIERESEYIADIRARLAHVRGDDTPLFAQRELFGGGVRP